MRWQLSRQRSILRAVERQPTKSSVIEFHSSKAQRVVRSSLAAESCAMTSAADNERAIERCLEQYIQ